MDFAEDEPKLEVQSTVLSKLTIFFKDSKVTK